MYVVATLEVILFAEYTWFLAALLLADLALVRWHMGTPHAFAVLAVCCTPLATACCVKLSHHTWWYAHGLDLLGFPPWLCPMHGLFAHWVLDAYFLATLTDVRKSTLP